MLRPVVAGLLSCALFAAPAMAQTWQVKCSADKMTDEKQCHISMLLTQPGTANWIGVGYYFPEGVFTVGGKGTATRVRVRVDNKSVDTLTTCVMQICMDKSGVFFELLRRGTTMRVEFTSREYGVVGPLEANIEGFYDAYTKLVSEMKP